MRNIYTCLLALAVSCSSYGIESAADSDYYSNSYEERKINFKIKPSFVFFTNKVQQIDMPSPKSLAAQNNPQTLSPLLLYALGIEAAATLFFTEHIASEVSLGTYLYSTNESSVKSIGYNYSDDPQYTDNKDIYTLPAAVILQMHLAPFGGIRPYVGGGVMGMLLYTRSKDFRLQHTWNTVTQIGIDFSFRDESLIGIEVKKYWSMAPIIHYQRSMLGQEITGRLQMNSFVVSANFGLTF